jgi:hypothetical protein
MGKCALIALRLDQTIPRAVSAAGFRFGNALLAATSNAACASSEVGKGTLRLWSQLPAVGGVGLAGEENLGCHGGTPWAEGQFVPPAGLCHDRYAILTGGFAVREAPRPAGDSADLGVPDERRISRSCTGPVGVEPRLTTFISAYGQCLPASTRSLRSFPDLKKGTDFASTATAAPLRGLRLTRGSRRLTVKAPKPRSSTRSPRASAPVMPAKMVATMVSTSSPRSCGLAAASSAISSDLVNAPAVVSFGNDAG